MKELLLLFYIRVKFENILFSFFSGRKAGRCCAIQSTWYVYKFVVITFGTKYMWFSLAL